MKILLLLMFILVSCSGNDRTPENISKHIESPYVLLISLDGFRWDYTDHYKPKFLSAFKSEAARLESLRASFPTKTFPNHLSIVTGRYPAKHGIVANSFFAPDLGLNYSLGNKKAVRDGRFYQAMPLWSLAESQGMRTATYFWPGSEAEISGERPSYYLPYKHNTPHQNRIDHVIDWFKLPKEKRPHFVTLYFHDVDSAGHHHGPISEGTKNAVMKVDSALEQLVTRLRELSLPLNIVVVSDHGMMDLSERNFEVIIKDKEDRNHFKNFKAIGEGPLVHFYKKGSPNIKLALDAFNTGAQNYKCYTNQTTPARLNFRDNPRIGDIVCIANYKWSIGVDKSRPILGSHGWSQFQTKDMHGIFYAQGPHFKKSVLPTKENVNIYPLIAEILGLEIRHKIDGKLKEMNRLLK